MVVSSGNRSPAQVNADKATHRAGLIEGFFRTRIRQVEPVLEKVDSQHPLQSNRRATVAGFGVERFDRFTKLIPWNDLVHLRQKLLPAGRLAEALKVAGGKGLLFHQCLSNMNYIRIIADVRT